jgi:hypothetical protein
MQNDSAIMGRKAFYINWLAYTSQTRNSLQAQFLHWENALQLAHKI